MSGTPLLVLLDTIQHHPDSAMADRAADALLAVSLPETPVSDDPVLAALHRRDVAAAAALARATGQEHPLLEFMAGHLAMAENLLAQAASSDAVALRLRGCVAYARGDLAMAEYLYRAGLAAAPGMPELLRNLARVRRVCGDAAESMALLHHCLMAHPDFPAAQENLLMSLRSLGDAANEYRHAARLAHDEDLSPSTRLTGVRSLLFLGHLDIVDRLLAVLVEKVTDPAGLRAAAGLAADRGAVVQALSLLERIPAPRRTIQDGLVEARLRLPLNPALALQALHRFSWQGHTPTEKAARAQVSILAGEGHPPAAPDGILTARSYREFFQDAPFIGGEEGTPPPPDAAAVLARLHPTLATATTALAEDRERWRMGRFIAGPCDFDVLVTSVRRSDKVVVPAAIIVGDGSYVNSRISQRPLDGMVPGGYLSPSFRHGIWMPDWHVPDLGPVSETVEGAVLLGGHENHGHFLWEILGRAALVASEPAIRGLPVHAILCNALQRNCMEHMLHGHPLVELTPGDRPRLIRYRNAFAVQDPSYWTATREVNRQLKALAGPSEGNWPSRIFLSRRAYRPDRHRLANEEELEQSLRRRGFTVIQPETLSIAQTIHMMAGAEMIVASVGAALSNLPFARPGTGVVEIAPRYQAGDGVWHWTLPFCYGYPGINVRRLYGDDLFIEPGTGLNWLTSIDPARVHAEIDDLEPGRW